METYSRIGLLRSHECWIFSFYNQAAANEALSRKEHYLDGSKSTDSFECIFTSFPLVSSVFYIFSTFFECGFTSFPLVSSVVLHLLHFFRVRIYIFPTRFECVFTSSPLVSSVVLGRSVVVRPYTSFSGPLHGGHDERALCKTTLETSGKDVKLHSKRVGKM